MLPRGGLAVGYIGGAGKVSFRLMTRTVSGILWWNGWNAIGEI